MFCVFCIHLRNINYKISFNHGFSLIISMYLHKKKHGVAVGAQDSDGVPRLMMKGPKNDDGEKAKLMMGPRFAMKA